MQALKNIVINGAMTLALLFGLITSASAESEFRKEMDRSWNKTRAEAKRQQAEHIKASDEYFEILRAEKKIQASKPIPKIGMNKSKVIKDTSWGDPDYINTTINANGTHEQWIYRSYSGMSSSRYLNFINDKLTSIQY